MCENIGPKFVECYCTKCRADLHYETNEQEAKEGSGHKFVPTGLTYFTTLVTYQYVHLNSGIHFRSEEINAEKAGAYWLSQLDYINEAKGKKILDLGLLGTYIFN
jgi:hypothetical protein